MYKGIAIGLLSLCFISVTGCSPSMSTNETPEMVEANILLPGKITLNQPNTLKVQVKQGKKTVDDAEDVEFEIWKSSSKEKSELLKAKHASGGLYEVNKTFKTNGIYFIQTHVTARGLHVMPKKQVVVGILSKKEIQILHDSQTQNESPEHNHHH